MRQLRLFMLACSICTARADINSGCPSWGCLSWGSFSLSAGAPPSNGKVKWSTEIDYIQTNETGSGRGCVSDQETVVCATHSGYVSLDPQTGKVLWNYTAMTSPYLPVMDIYGDVIGMDANELVYVGADGKPEQPIPIKPLHPNFSVMASNNSMLLLTSSHAYTAQIFTYDADGVIAGAITLTGKVEGMKGSFVPSGHPIIAGSRAYVMTQFIPDNSSSRAAEPVVNKQRLYAIDLLQQMAPRLKIAWYFELERGVTIRDTRSKSTDLGMEPIVTYFRNTVYINNPGNFLSADPRQPFPGILWALRDDGDRATLLFKTFTWYGPMAVYDTYDKPMGHMAIADEDHVIWVVNRSPGMIAGHSVLNGTILGSFNVYDIAGNLSWISSLLSVTRQSGKSTDDVLLFGADDGNGQAWLVAVETDVLGNASLMWKSRLSAPNKSKDYIYWLVGGQIANVVVSKPEAATGWQKGLVAMVLENGQGYSKKHVVGVF